MLMCTVVKVTRRKEERSSERSSFNDHRIALHCNLLNGIFNE
jgi:5-enolpyruvylshikimate-3-phosphate synthase